MRLAQLWLFVSSIFFVTVHASVGARGYEALYFYYVYKMDFALHPGDTLMATHCNTARVCTLAEFLTDILVYDGANSFQAGLVADPGRTLIETDTPDVERAAQRLNAGGYYSAVLDATKTKLTPGANFAAWHTEIANHVQQLRQEQEARGQMTPPDEFNRAVTALDRGQLFRLSENSGDLLTALTNQGVHFVSTSITVQGVDGNPDRPLVVVDEDKTSRLLTTAQATAFTNAIQTILAYNGSDKPTKLIRNHLRATTAINAGLQRFRGPSTC